MSTEENKALSKRIFEEIFNKRNLALVDELFDTNFIAHGSPDPARGIESVKQNTTNVVTAFPDIHYTIDDMVAEGDKVAIRFTQQGTHQGDFMGIAATGKKFTSSGIIIQRITSGKVAEWWVGIDAFVIMQQLGVVPSMGESGGS